MDDCPMLANPGGCDLCGAALTGKRTRWCSDRCSREFAFNHYWSNARREAKRRARYRCKTCGRGPRDHRRPKAAEFPDRRSYLAAHAEWKAAVKAVRLEVNHVVPRNGGGYGPGCWHHQSNLEVLCVDCHRKVTAAQRRARIQSPDS